MQAYYDTFNDGFKNYINGDWKRANRILKLVPKMKGMDDAPSEKLIKFMSETDFEAPLDW